MSRLNKGLAEGAVCALARTETHAQSVAARPGGPAAVRRVGRLLEAFSGSLLVEEVLLDEGLGEPADEARILIETLRTRLRESIDAALIAPADAFDRAELLRQVIDFDGYDSPLVSRSARALAGAVAPRAS